MAKKRAKRRKAEPPKPPPESPPSAAPNKVAVAFVLAGVAVLAYVLLTTESPQQQASPVPSLTDLERWQSAPTVDISLSPERVRALGPENAPVTIVEYSDFECPYCRDASAVFKQLQERYPGQIRLVFKNYPLDTTCNEYVERQVHYYACKAAVMAYCAGAQDRFWEMHDAIFRLEALSLGALDALPREIGLAEGAFTACTEDEGTMRALRADMDEGNKLGVRGTPAVYVNGKRAPSFRADSLVPIIEHVLAEGS